jgi:hypothetical protein
MNMHRLVIAVALAVAGCQTWGPTWSELSGDRYTSAIADRRPAILISAGDESIGSTVPYKLAPGTYDVRVQSLRHDGFRGSIETLRLNVEPCKRYYINAQFADPVRPDWKPVVDYVDTIPGCTVTPR